MSQDELSRGWAKRGHLCSTLGFVCLFVWFFVFFFKIKVDRLSLEDELTNTEKGNERTQTHQVWSGCRAGWRPGHGRSLPSSERRLCTAWESAWRHTGMTTSTNVEPFTFSFDCHKCLTRARWRPLSRSPLTLGFFHHAAAEQTLIASLVMLVWTGRPPSLMRTSTL